MEKEIIRIMMLCTVRGQCLISPPGTILRAGEEYEAKSNPLGAISGLCQNGLWLGIKPSEFEFVKAPAWVLEIWAAHITPAARSADKLLQRGE